MDIWFTADQHFDHANIIEYCDRPFIRKDGGNILRATTMMNKKLIQWHNELVKPEDTVYHVGDFTMRGTEYKEIIRKNFVRKLNGVKHLILGNHDRLKPFDYVDIGFMSVHTCLYMENFEWYLAHDPAAAVVNKRKLWLCGHVHHGLHPAPNVINVGVDMWKYRPVHIDQIIALAKEKGI